LWCFFHGGGGVVKNLTIDPGSMIKVMLMSKIK
jgi:hypothetical protein